MDTNRISKTEINALLEADNELALHNKTSIKCPRCNNEIIVEPQNNSKSYVVRCKTKDCIKTTMRGI